MILGNPLLDDVAEFFGLRHNFLRLSLGGGGAQRVKVSLYSSQGGSRGEEDVGNTETTRSGRSTEGAPPEDRSGTGRQYQWSFRSFCARGDYYEIESSSRSR